MSGANGSNSANLRCQVFATVLVPVWLMECRWRQLHRNARTLMLDPILLVP